MLKDYLNKTERVQLLFLKKYIDNIEKMLEWTSLTKDERKNLKTAMTFGLKGFNSIVERLNETALSEDLGNCRYAYRG